MPDRLSANGCILPTSMKVPKPPTVKKIFPDSKAVKPVPLLSNSDWVSHIASTSYDVMWDWDFKLREVYVGESVSQVFGYEINYNSVPYALCIKRITNEHRIRVQKKLQTVLASHQLTWTDKFSILKADGTIASTMSRASIIRDDAGTAIRMIGAMQDVTKLMKLEETIRQLSIDQKAATAADSEQQLRRVDQLAEEIVTREIGIAAAVVDAQELVRSELGRELHDNVTQLLGASQLYLDMARTEEGDVSIYLNQSEAYTRSAIQAIRELSKGLISDTLNDFGLSPAVDKLVCDTMEVQPLKISFVIDQKLDERLNLKCKLNIFRMIQEQVNNICKHAKAGNVSIHLTQNKYSVILTVSDDGVGFDVQELKKGIGLSNIRSRSALFNGAVNVLSQPGEGCTIKIIFPVNNILFVSAT
jgi:signal transduction histidine kinase